MLPWDLEDWITDVGANVLDKREVQREALNEQEELVYEIWLLDTEARNGGLSQYFLNHGLAQWESCRRRAGTLGLMSIHPFVEAVNQLLLTAEDPYDAIRSGGDSAEDLWYQWQAPVVQELRALCQHAL